MLRAVGTQTETGRCDFCHALARSLASSLANRLWAISILLAANNGLVARQNDSFRWSAERRYQNTGVRVRPVRIVGGAIGNSLVPGPLRASRANFIWHDRKWRLPASWLRRLCSRRKVFVGGGYISVGLSLSSTAQHTSSFIKQ